MAEFRKQNEELLNARREKLVALLTTEEKQYEQEFFANLETPEQVREKMAKRLNELRSKREEMRKEEVEKKLETRFRQSADELRKLDSQFVAVNTKLEQEQQMLEKVKRQEDQMQGTAPILIYRGANVCKAIGSRYRPKGIKRNRREEDTTKASGRAHEAFELAKRNKGISTSR